MSTNLNPDGSLQTTAYNFTSPLMNTWTNNKFINNKESGEHEKEQRPKKLTHRPRSGNPSPTKMLPDSDSLQANLLVGYNSRQNPIYVQKPSYSSGFTNSKQIVHLVLSNLCFNNIAGLVQTSNNPPQPHQRNIKKSMIGYKQNNVPNDMYRIYGVNKSDLGAHTAGNTPKTSSGKRNINGSNHFSLRMNNQMVPSRVTQHTSHGNRSVSPNRLLDQNVSNEKDLFIGQNRPNMVDILKYQARTNLKNLEKDMSSLLGRNKRVIEKKKIGESDTNP